MIDINWRRQLWRSLLTSIMAVVIIFSAFGCSSRTATPPPPEVPKSAPAKVQPNISEASPPAVIQQLRQQLDNYQPQVKILSPQPDEVLQDNTVTVQFQVQDLPIFKNADLGLGPHLHVFLDNQPYQAVYNASEPLVFEDLPPGTHTLRVFASRPWHESFKNEAAYAQTTFHIFTKTEENNPNPTQPLLTYSRPQASYGAEPIMLDFYLTNLPPLAAGENPDIGQVQIRCTINGESFTLDQWQPIYLKGFQPGKNWVQLELLDEQGNPIKNTFNNTIRVISYNPEGKDTLAQLVRGELSADDARGIVDPGYVAKEPEPTPVPEATPTPTPSETPTPAPEATETLAPAPSPAPTVEETPAVEPPQEELPQVESTKPSETEPTVSEPIEAPKSGGFYSSSPRPTASEATSSPAPLVTQPKQVEKPKFGGFFNRFRRLPVVAPSPAPSLPPTLPEVIVTPAPEPIAPKAEPEVNPSISPQPSLELTTPVEEKQAAEKASETNTPTDKKETIQPAPEATPESELEVSSELTEPSPPATEPEASTTPEPSETQTPEKTTGVLTES